MRAGMAATAGLGGVGHFTGAHPAAIVTFIVVAVILIGLVIHALDWLRRSRQDAPTPGLRPLRGEA
jgi:hypothetical protein